MFISDFFNTQYASCVLPHLTFVFEFSDKYILETNNLDLGEKISFYVQIHVLSNTGYRNNLPNES